jgi:hypothetical protein
MPTPKPTNEIITAAILGFEQQKRQIDTKIGELRAMLPGGTTQTAATPEPTKHKRRKMSAAGRKAISEATKKRWAAFHAAKQPEKPALKKAAKAKAAAKKVAPARKKATAKKAAVQTAPAKAGKRPPVKKAAATKKTAPVAAQGATEAAGQ